MEYRILPQTVVVGDNLKDVYIIEEKSTDSSYWKFVTSQQTPEAALKLVEALSVDKVSNYVV